MTESVIKVSSQSNIVRSMVLFIWRGFTGGLRGRVEMIRLID